MARSLRSGAPGAQSLRGHDQGRQLATPSPSSAQIWKLGSQEARAAWRSLGVLPTFFPRQKFFMLSFCFQGRRGSKGRRPSGLAPPAVPLCMQLAGSSPPGLYQELPTQHWGVGLAQRAGLCSPTDWFPILALLINDRKALDKSRTALCPFSHLKSGHGNSAHGHEGP